MSERIEVRIEKLVHGGSGLAHLDQGRTVFVNNVLPGEQVLIEIKRRRKGILEAVPVEIVIPSRDRIKPLCDGELQCTGATWPHIAYPAQVRYKEEILLDTLSRISGFSPAQPLAMLPSPKTDHYRLRTQFNVRTIQGKQRIGFFQQGSYRLVEVDDAFLLDPLINQTLKAIRSQIAELPHLSELHINSTPTRQVHLLMFGDQGPFPEPHSFFQKLKASIPELVGLTGFSNRQKICSLGEKQLHLDIEGLALNATEGNFYQVNWDQNRAMVRSVLDFAALTGTETVLDLYCGIGNFALPLAKRARSVVGIESGFSAIEDAKANATLNNIENAEFIADDMDKGLKALMNRKMRADVIVLDPPRAGATLTTLERVLAFVPRKIIYVSCNPSTLARDLKFFHLFGFRLDRLQPVDMFPYTYHIECVAEMVREEG